MVGQPINPKGSPPPLAPYSPGFRAGETGYTSGILPLDLEGNLVGGDDVGVQTRQVLDNISAILEAAGGCMNDVVFNLIFLANLDDYQKMNDVYGSFFPNNPPARACIQAGLVKPEFKVEIAATASISE